MDNFGSDYKPGYYDKDGNNRFNKAKEVLVPFLGNIEKPWEDSGRAVMLKMSSEKASTLIQDNTLDFCYIDGDHSLEMIFDLYSWVPKIRRGGICSGHDYKDGPKSGMTNFFGGQLDYKVKTCVDYYCLRHGYKLNIIGGRILSWFFVKSR
jgi:hypothetical protein